MKGFFQVVKRIFINDVYAGKLLILTPSKLTGITTCLVLENVAF